MSTSRSGFSLTTNAAGVISRLLALTLVVGVGLYSIDRASAGVITSSGDDAAYRSLFANQFAGPFNGVSGGVGYVRIEFDNGSGGRATSFASATIYNATTVLVAGHAVVGFQPFNPTFSIGTGTNFNSDPGHLYGVSGIAVHPTYTSLSSSSSGADIAKLTLSTPISGATQRGLASSRPSAGETVSWGGFGRTGSPAVGYTLQDGAGRAGYLVQSSFPPISTLSQYYYGNLSFHDEESLHLGAGNGDSGAPILNAQGELFGLMTARSLVGPGGPSYYLDLTLPETAAFLNSGSTTAVPEPVGVPVVVSSIAGLSWLLRRRRPTVC